MSRHSDTASAQPADGERPLLDTAWTRSLARGEAPDPASLRDHLLAVHGANAGFTEACASRCRDARGRSSYAWLADALDPAQHRDVLDLACGSGPLLELVAARHGDRLCLTGVDMSEAELALARARVPDADLTLYQGLAQEMTFLADASQDAVLCHWALTLMDPVAPVLREVRRVLRPGGTFAAIVDGEMDAAPGYRAVHDLIYGWVQHAYPAYGRFDLGDARVRDTQALAALAREVFDDSGLGAEVRVEPGVLTLSDPPETLAREAAGFFYAAFVLSAQANAAMLADLAELLRASGGDPPTFAMPINRLVVTRAAS
jgi:ubiquinone/menaquinone biosynthesis C-methylase UbiE